MSKTQGDGRALSPLLVHNSSDGFSLGFGGATQSIPTGATPTNVTAWAGVSATDSINTTTGIRTVKNGGYYQIDAGISWAPNAGAGNRAVHLYKNGALITTVQLVNVGTTSDVVTLLVKTSQFAAGDTANIAVSHNAGTNVVISAAWWGMFPVCEKMNENFL